MSDPYDGPFRTKFKVTATATVTRSFEVTAWDVDEVKEFALDIFNPFENPAENDDYTESIISIEEVNP